MSNQPKLLLHPQILAKSLVACLNQLVQQHNTNPETSSVFNLKSAPTISVGDYVGRTTFLNIGMIKYMNASLSVYIYSLILLDRAQQYNPEFIIHKRNIHRLLLVSNMVAAKYIDDMYYKNSFYATVGGVSLKVLNELQMEFLNLINFNCHCEHDTFQAYLDRLDVFAQVNETQVQKKQNAVNVHRQIRRVSRIKNEQVKLKNEQVKLKNEKSQTGSLRSSQQMIKPEKMSNE